MEVGYVEHCSCKCINNDPIIRQQIKDTCNERCGVNCSLHSLDAKQKSMNSIREHYGDGVSNVFQSEQVKCLIRERKKEKYDNPTFVNPNKAIKTRRQKHNGRYESIETTKNRMKTFQDRYGIGVVNAGQTPQHKNAFQDLDKLHRAKELERQTKLKNGSYAKSKLEDKCYSDLIQKFCHVERQYTSELYPFRCDFYVEKIDSLTLK